MIKLTKKDIKMLEIARMIPEEHREYVIQIAPTCSHYTHDRSTDNLFRIYREFLPNKFRSIDIACLNCRKTVKVDMVALIPYLNKLKHEKKLLESIK